MVLDEIRELLKELLDSVKNIEQIEVTVQNEPGLFEILAVTIPILVSIFIFFWTRRSTKIAIQNRNWNDFLKDNTKQFAGICSFNHIRHVSQFHSSIDVYEQLLNRNKNPQLKKLIEIARSYRNAYSSEILSFFEVTVKDNSQEDYKSRDVLSKIRLLGTHISKIFNYITKMTEFDHFSTINAIINAAVKNFDTKNEIKKYESDLQNFLKETRLLQKNKYNDLLSTLNQAQLVLENISKEEDSKLGSTMELKKEEYYSIDSDIKQICYSFPSEMTYDICVKLRSYFWTAISKPTRPPDQIRSSLKKAINFISDFIVIIEQILPNIEGNRDKITNMKKLFLEEIEIQKNQNSKFLLVTE